MPSGLTSDARKLPSSNLSLRIQNRVPIKLTKDENRRFELAIQRAVLNELATLDRLPKFTAGSFGAFDKTRARVDWRKILGFFVDAVT